MADDLYAFIPCLNAEGSEGFFIESCLPSLKVTGIVQLPPDSVKAHEK